MPANNEHAETGLPTLSDAEKAKKLLKANLTNVGKKVLQNVPLSAGEVKFLEGIIEQEPEHPDEPAAPSGKEPKNAKNQADLARILKVSRKTINRYAKHKDAPEPKSNGGLPVTAWRAFLAEHEVEVDGEDDLDHSALKARQILLQNRLLEQKIELNDGKVYPADKVEQETAELIATAKAVLLPGPASLAPQVVGVSIPEAESLLRQWLHDALSKLHANPLGRKDADHAE